MKWVGVGELVGRWTRGRWTGRVSKLVGRWTLLVSRGISMIPKDDMSSKDLGFCWIEKIVFQIIKNAVN